MKISKNEKKLLSYLFIQNDWVTGESIARHLDVSDRTIRNYVASMNESLSKANCKILSERGKGYRLRFIDSEKIFELINHENVFKTSDSIMRSIAVKLILSEESVNLNDLEDEFFLSRTKIDLVLREIRFFSEKLGYKEAFIRKNNCVSCSLNEKDKRLLAADFINNNTFDVGEIIDNSYGYFLEENVHSLMEIVREFMDEFSIIITDSDMFKIIVIMHMQINRIKDDYELDCSMEDVESSIFPYVSEVTHNILDSISKEFAVDFSYNEKLFFSKQFSNLRFLTSNNITKNEILNVVESRYTIVVQKLLEDIKEEFNIDFTDDEKLFVDLTLHVRFSCGLSDESNDIKNPVLDEIKNKFPFVFELSTCIFNRFAEYFDFEINENQLSYIAAHLGGALERKNKHIEKKRESIAVCSSLNVSIIWLLMSKLSTVYGNSFDIVGPYPIYQFKDLLLNKPSIIVTTSVTPQANHSNIPVVTVSAKLEEADIQAINLEIEKLKRKESQKTLPTGLDQFFSKELFFWEYDFPSQTEVLQFLTQEIMKQGYAEDGLLESTLEREKMASTAFQNNVAIPHPVKHCANQTVIAVLKLKKPIPWGTSSSQLILYFVTNQKEKHFFHVFFSLFSDVVTDKLKVDKLMKKSDYQEFVHELLS